MSIRLEVPWHRFARGEQGYTTIANSANLSAESRARLERFGWGQPTDASYYGRIETEPAIWIEPMAPRMALTRVLPGARDVAGRRTLSFVTILPTFTEYELLLKEGLSEVFRDNSQWEFHAPELASIQARKSAPICADPSPAFRRLLKYLESRPPGTALVVAPGLVSFEEAIEVLRRLPSDAAQQMRIAFNAASNALSADLVILAPEYSSEPAQIARLLWDGTSDVPKPEAGRVSISVSPRPISSTAGPRSGLRTPTVSRPKSQRGLRMDSKVIAAFVGVALLVVILGVANLMVTSNQIQGAQAGFIDDIQPTKGEIQSLGRELADIKVELKATSKQVDEMTNENGRLATVLSEIGMIKSRIDKIEQDLAKQHVPAPAIAPVKSSATEPLKDDTAKGEEQHGASKDGGGW